jgi:hypothetical protein
VEFCTIEDVCMLQPLDLANRQAQEQMDAQLAAQLHAENLREMERARAVQSASSSSQSATPMHRLDIALNDLHNVALILLPLCTAEFVLVTLSIVLAKALFIPTGKAYYIWIDFAHTIKSLMGVSLAVLCVCIQKEHLPRHQPLKAMGLVKDNAWFYRLASNLDLMIVMFFTFMLASVCLVVLGIVLPLSAGNSKHSSEDTKVRCTFVVIIAVTCGILLALQCVAIRPLYSLLRLWSELFRVQPAYAPLPPASSTSSSSVS